MWTLEWQIWDGVRAEIDRVKASILAYDWTRTWKIRAGALKLHDEC